MKYLVSLLAVIFFLTLSCHKTMTFDEFGYYGEGSAMLNTLMFEGKTRILYEDIFCYPDSCLTILISNSSGNGLNYGNILLRSIPRKTGKFELRPEGQEVSDHLYQFYYGVLNDDLILGSYHIFEKDTSNWIIIEKLDLKTREVSGSFQAKVTRDPYWLSPGHPLDTIIFKKGKFYGKIYK